MTKLKILLSLTVWFLLPTFAHSQTIIQFCNVKMQSPWQAQYLGKNAQGDSMFLLQLSQGFRDSTLKATADNTVQGFDIGVLKSTKADNSTVSGLGNDVQGLKTTKADITYVNNAIGAIVIPPGTGIPVPITITASTTITAPYNTDIWCKPPANTTLTLTITPQQPGWHYKVHNTGQGIVSFKGAGVTLINSVSLGKNLRPLDLSFQTATSAEIH